MKILMCNTVMFPFAIGGISNVTYHLVKHLSEYGHQIKVVMSIPTERRKRSEYLLETTKLKNVEIIPVYVKYVSKLETLQSLLLKTFLNVPATIRSILPIDYEIIHFHSLDITNMSFLRPLVAKLLKNTYSLFTCHDAPSTASYYASKSQKYPLTFSKIKYRTYQFVWRYIDTVVTPSNFLLTLLKNEKFGPTNMIMIPNGIDLHSFQKAKRTELDGEPAILNVGYWTRAKGIDLLLSAFKRIKREFRDAKLHIVGEHDFEDCRAKKLEKKGIFLYGPLPYQEVLSIYKGGDICIFPSRRDTFGMPVLEAMAAGIPTIATKLPPFKELIENYVNGFLVNFNPDEISKTVKKLWENESLRSKICYNALQKAKSFDWNNIAKRYEQVYYDLLNSR